MHYNAWPPYIPVAARRANAAREMAKLRKNGVKIQPVVIEGRKITRNFWGLSWCEHIETFRDFESRLPRGKRYVRNGSVCDLNIDKGIVKAIVSGSELYKVAINIETLPKKKWTELVAQCSGKLNSILEMLQGTLSEEIMAIVTNKQNGLFPNRSEVTFECDCPDYASMCKHIAAVFYGIGNRLDSEPELLFSLRGVDHQELIKKNAVSNVVAGSKGKR
ncbi:MAG: SWIM zinc finger family protein, partial [Planctomycetota bacterium]|nr:SWIM zinc finger family protein [Planctomycetota bacterium]